MLKRFAPYVLFTVFALAVPLALPACHEHEAAAAKHDCASHAGKPCQMMAGHEGKPCSMTGHKGKSCPMMEGGKPCDEACMKACKEKHAGKGCPMMAGHEGKSCPMMEGGKACDEACMKACKEKHGAGHDCAGHESKPCSMMAHADKPCSLKADGKPCDKPCEGEDAKMMHGGHMDHAPGSAEDRAAITATALDYAEGWYAGDAGRMGRAVHPDLAKRVVAIDPKSGNGGFESMNREKLVAGTRAGSGTKVPADQQRKDVRILDVYGNAATVKLTMAGWVDYLHLGRINDRWVIVNVLWEKHPARAAVPHAGHMGEKSLYAGKGDGVKTCPVSGEPVDANTVATIGGRKVKFCCLDCINAARENPAKYISANTGVSAAN